MVALDSTLTVVVIAFTAPTAVGDAKAIGGLPRPLFLFFDENGPPFPGIFCWRAMLVASRKETNSYKSRGIS